MAAKVLIILQLMHIFEDLHLPNALIGVSSDEKAGSRVKPAFSRLYCQLFGSYQFPASR